MTHTAVLGPVAAPGLHVMSYNIRRRLPHLNRRSPDRWVHRRPLLGRLLAAEQPALLGVQEALFDQASFVRHSLGEHYRSVGHGRETNKGGEGCPIFYDTRRLRLLDWRQSALSDTPDVAGSTSWGNRTPRVLVAATMRDLATASEFLVVNTHFDHRSRVARMRSARALHTVVRDSGLPTVVTGDFNTDAGTGPHTLLTAQGALCDSWDVAEHRLSEAWGTFPNYRPPRHDRKRIDWILVSADVRVSSAAINVTRFERGWPSDHAAVQAVITFAD